MTRAYYNENDPYCAQWLRNLIQQNLIAPGTVDERDIRDIAPNELTAYTQCHFFAGIGGWSLALRLAAIPDHFPLWTGSCPCQPFSQAGKRRGFADERHLWPHWFHLIGVCRPPTILGEQVARATVWLDQVRSDLEAQNFAFGAADIPATSVGANHIRYRTWFVAHANERALRIEPRRSAGASGENTPFFGANGASRPLANPNGKPSKRLAIPRQERDSWSPEPAVGRVVDGVSYELVGPALKGFGNAIVPQVAAQFIKAALDT